VVERRVATRVHAVACLLAVASSWPSAVLAQAGPPFLTNDPGTPGDRNWEINIGAMPVISAAATSIQLPQLDFNFGVGDRIQLTYEVPYLLQSAPRVPSESGWGNGTAGVKWRFLDEGEGGLQVSTFPQVELSVSLPAERRGLATPGPRYLLPVELTRRIGPFDVDVEAGYYLAGVGPRERILGFAAGRTVTDRLELDGEIYDDRADGAVPHYTTLDLGGRYKLRRGLIALVMAGRALNRYQDRQPDFQAYLGVQVLLSDYGRSWGGEP
jgi:hypothetical protein